MLCLNNDLCFWTKLIRSLFLGILQVMSSVVSHTYFIGKKEGNIRREGGQVSV